MLDIYLPQKNVSMFSVVITLSFLTDCLVNDDNKHDLSNIFSAHGTESHDCLITFHLSSFLVNFKVSKGAKIRSRYNQVPHPTKDTNGKVTTSQLDTTNESQEVSPFPTGDHKAH